MKTIYITMIFTLTCLPFTYAGLVGHWTFDGSASTVAKDSGPYKNNAVLVKVKRVKGKLGSAIAVSSKNHTGIEVKSSPSLNPHKAISICLWVKFSQFKPNKTYELVAKALDSGNTRNTAYRFRITWGRLNLIVGDGKTTDYAPISRILGTSNQVKIKAGQWYHLAAVFDGMSMRYFVNGIETEYSLPKELSKNIIESPGSIKANNQPLSLGGYAQNSKGYRFNGAIDDVRIYNNALTHREILELSKGMATN